MNRIFTVMKDPVAWILVIAGVVELLSGGTAARGAILFAGAGLILADRIRLGLARARARVTAGTVQTELPHRLSPGALQAAVLRSTWIAAAVVAVLVTALFAVHSLPLTAATGLVGILVVGWAWLTQPDEPSTLRPARLGLLVWAGLFLALGLWELTALLGQPTLTDMSYDHPTISYLLDPVLATYPGRVLGFALWAAAGRGLVRRA